MDDVLLYIFRMIDDLKIVSGVNKRWNKLSVASMKHPIAAAKCGDSYSLGLILRMYRNRFVDPKGLCSIVDKLASNGHVSLSIEFAKGTPSIGPSMKSLLESNDKNVVFSILRMSLESPHIPSHIAFKIGMLGPSSLVYKMYTRIDTRTHWLSFERGLARGGHLDALIYHTKYIDGPTSDLSDILSDCIESGDVRVFEYGLSRVSPGKKLKANELYISALSSQKTVMIRHVVQFIENSPPHISLLNKPDDFERKMLSSMGYIRIASKELYLYVEKITGWDIRYMAKHLEDEITNEEFALFMIERGLTSRPEYICKAGFIEAATRCVIKYNTNCQYCFDVFHRKRDIDEMYEKVIKQPPVSI